MIIAVAGGTGRVGREVVAAARAAGHEPRVLARSTGVDLRTGQGLEAALTGADAVVDVCNLQTPSRRKAEQFFGLTTGHLLTAGARAGVRHHVALSIVGCDRVDTGYYLAKRIQERLVLSPAAPGSVLRATQFHEFAAQITAYPGPVVLAPHMRSQPVAARDVAQALVELAAGPPVGLAPDLAGPEVHDMAELVRALLRARRSHRITLPLRIPGRLGRQLVGGALLPTSPGPRGTETFDAWLTRTGGDQRPPGRAWRGAMG